MLTYLIVRPSVSNSDCKASNYDTLQRKFQPVTEIAVSACTLLMMESYVRVYFRSQHHQWFELSTTVKKEQRTSKFFVSQANTHKSVRSCYYKGFTLAPCVEFILFEKCAFKRQIVLETCRWPERCRSPLLSIFNRRFVIRACLHTDLYFFQNITHDTR